MADVVCLDLPAGEEFFRRMRAAWNEGDAIFAIDQRLPSPARSRLLEQARPTVIVDRGGERRVEGDPTADGDAVLVASSGTGGDPKIAVLTRDSIVAGANAVAERLQIDDTDRWWACLPVAHVGGLSVLSRALVLGTPVSIAAQFSVAAYDDAATAGCTLVSLVATALARVDPSRFRTILVGGSAAPSPRPTNVIATYGMTETGGGVVYDGRALDGVEIRIVPEPGGDDIAGRGDMAANAIGGIELRCPMLLRSYRDGSSPISVDGWYATGDLGQLRDGVLDVHGRADDRIVTGGEKVWPDDVERVLRTHHLVADVCVGGVVDDEWGEAVHAWVVPSGGDVPTLDSLRDHVKRSLPAYCAPKVLHLVEEIPRTALGKARRRSLTSSARSERDRR